MDINSRPKFERLSWMKPHDTNNPLCADEDHNWHLMFGGTEGPTWFIGGEIEYKDKYLHVDVYKCSICYHTKTEETYVDGAKINEEYKKLRGE